jgi:hypothetical protein
MTEHADQPPSRATGLRALGVTPQREVEALLKDQLIPEAVLEQLIEEYSTIPRPEEDTLVHRTLSGTYEYCHTHTCELLFHFPDVTPEQMEFVPLEILMSMLEISQPPNHDLRGQTEHLAMLHHIHSMSMMYSRNYERLDEVLVSWSAATETGYLTHRDYDLPAIIRESGIQEWIQRGHLHRTNDKPARVKADGSQEWYWFSQRHRGDDKPAVINADGSMEWWHMDKLHREGAPARTWPNGREEWYENGQLHRDGAPAVVGSGNYEAWYQHGKLHRDDGPAHTDEQAGSLQWYVHGKRIRAWYGKLRWQILRYWLPIYEPLAASSFGKAVGSSLRWLRRSLPVIWSFVRHPLRPRSGA